MPHFSVIIPTYNRARFLEDALDSVLAQTVQDLEVIVIDDCSPEEVRHVDDPRVRVVRASQNGGAGAARNLGVAHSRGEVLTFLDDDDTWTPRRLEFALQGLARAPVSVCWQSDGGGRMLEGEVHDTILDTTTPNFGATAVLATEWHPIDATFRACEDLVWWLDITERCRVATHPEQGLVVRRHEGIRANYGARERILASQRLLAERDEYFDSHPAAAAHRLKRIGLMHLSLCEANSARRAFGRSLLRKPTAATVKHIMTTFR